MTWNNATGFLACVLYAATADALDLVSDPGFHRGFVVKNRAGKEEVLRWNDAVGQGKKPDARMAYGAARQQELRRRCRLLHISQERTDVSR